MIWRFSMVKNKIQTAVILSVLLVGGFLLFPGLTSCSSRQTVPLTYKFEAGRVTRYKNITKVDVRTGAENAPEEFMEKLEQSTTQINAETIVERSITDFTGNKATISLVNRNLGGRMVVGGKETIIAADQKKSEAIWFEMDSSGKILQMVLNEKEYGQEFALRKEEQIKMLQQVVLPNKKVKPGYQWTENFTTPLGLGAVELFIGGKIIYKYNGLEEFNGDECAVIEFGGDLHPLGDNQFSRKESNFNGKMTGKIYFDTSAGEIASYVQNYSLQYEAYVGEQNMQQSLMGAPVKIMTTAEISMITERIEESEE
jgi:hypothetical protein